MQFEDDEYPKRDYRNVYRPEWKPDLRMQQAIERCRGTRFISISPPPKPQESPVERKGRQHKDGSR